jgi:hypothetical protein
MSGNQQKCSSAIHFNNLHCDQYFKFKQTVSKMSIKLLHCNNQFNINCRISIITSGSYDCGPGVFDIIF